METKKLNDFFIEINVSILIICIGLMLFNPEFISVIHFSTGWLPVVSYATYSILETNFIFIIIILVSISIIFSISKGNIKVRDFLIKFNPIILLLLILSLFLNPQLFIIRPVGEPTRFDYLNIGGNIIIILLTALIVINLIYLIFKKKIKKYLIFLGFFIIGLWVCEFNHEIGHALLVVFSGGQVTEFIAFPFLLGNEIVAGYVSYTGVSLTFAPLVTIGGEIIQWIIITIIVFILHYKKWAYYLELFLKLVLIISWLDFPLYTINNMLGLPHWFIIGSSQGDIINFSYLTGIPMFIFLIAGVVQLVLGLFLFFYLKIFKSPFSKLKHSD